MNKLKPMLMRYRGVVGAIALVLAVVAIFWAVNSPAIVGASAATRELPIYSVKRDNKTVSLTFDAAWGDVRVRQLRSGAEKTPRVSSSFGLAVQTAII